MKMNEHDYEIYLLTLKEIEKKKNAPYRMANEELALKFHDEIQKKHPSAMLIKFGIHQWFTITRAAEKKLKKILEEDRASYLARALELENLINILDLPF